MDEESIQVAPDADDPAEVLRAAVEKLTAVVDKWKAETEDAPSPQLATIDTDQITKFLESNPDVYKQWVANWDSEKREILTRWSELMHQYRVSEDLSQRDFYNFLLNNADTITLEHAKHLTLHLRPAKKKGGRKPGQIKYEEDDKWAEIEILARWLKGEEITAVVKDVAERAAGGGTVASRERRLWRRLKAKGWSQ